MTESTVPCYVLNAASLFKGGAVQAATSFILHALEDEAVDWRFIISASIRDELALLGKAIPSSHCLVTEVSPAKSLACRGQVLNFVDAVSPVAVFTFFGPAYVRFNGPHLLGVADGWVTHSSWRAYCKLTAWRERVLQALRCCYNGWWYRQADAWVVEAECARAGLHRRFRVPLDKISVVANTCSPLYRKPCLGTDSLGERDSSVVRVLTLSAYYPHKNLELIPRVAHALKSGLDRDDVVFRVTLPTEGKDWQRLLAQAQALGVGAMLENLGPVSLRDGPASYAGADLVFLPSVLETFSANYPEAMASGRPIVTSDLAFARDVCGDAALYFRSDDPVDAARQIRQLLADRDLKQDLVSAGHRRLQLFPDSLQRYQQLVQLIQQMLAKQGNAWISLEER